MPERTPLPPEEGGKDAAAGGVGGRPPGAPGPGAKVGEKTD